MGFNIVWVGVDKSSKSELASLLTVRDTGLADETKEAPISAAELPNGWTIVVFNDLNPTLQGRIDALGPSRRLVTCAVLEGPMVSQVIHRHGNGSSWSVAHVSEHGLFDLKVEGTPPDFFETIKAKQIAEQNAENEADALNVDHIFDVPILLAEHVTGFRHDRYELESGVPNFTILA